MPALPFSVAADEAPRRAIDYAAMLDTPPFYAMLMPYAHDRLRASASATLLRLLLRRARCFATLSPPMFR